MKGVFDKIDIFLMDKNNESLLQIEITNIQNLTKIQLYAHGAQDRDWFLAMFQSLFKGTPTNGYKRRLERNWEYFGQ
jgi:hypothetical protein